MASEDGNGLTQGIQRARELVDGWQRLRDGVCRRCGADAGALRTLCSECADHRKVVRRDYRAAAAQRSSPGSVRMDHWLELHRWVTDQGFGLKEIAGSENESAGKWLTSFVDLLITTGDIDDDEVAQFEASANLLPVATEIVAAQRIRLIRARWFLDLQQGQLPIVATNLTLVPGEVCHLDVPVSMYTFPDHIRHVPGRLIVTDRRLILGRRSLPMIDVRRAVPYRGAIVVEPLTDGFFAAHDPQWVIALINTAAQISRGELAPPAVHASAPEPVSAFTAAATALEEDGRDKDAALVPSLSDMWSDLAPEMQVRAERAAEAIRSTYAVLGHLPPAGPNTDQVRRLQPRTERSGLDRQRDEGPEWCLVGRMRRARRRTPGFAALHGPMVGR